MRKSSSVIWSLLLLSSIAGIIIHTVTSPNPIPRPPGYKPQSRPQPKVKRSVFDEWKDMRARRVPEGTKVHWRLKVFSVLSDHYVAILEGNWAYEVECPRPYAFGIGEPKKLSPKYRDPAAGDWVEIQGHFYGVTPDGYVRLDLIDDFTNLGPRY